MNKEKCNIANADDALRFQTQGVKLRGERTQQDRRSELDFSGSELRALLRDYAQSFHNTIITIP